MRQRFILCAALATGLAATSASAVNFQKTGDDGWIEQWLSMEVVMQNGGFAASGGIDFLSEGTGGDVTHESVSTVKGLADITRQPIELDKKYAGEGMGEDGVWDWEVVEIDTDDSNNMSTGWGMVASDNFTWHGIIVMKAPSARSTTMHPAHDDYAQIWINGELVYDNDQWTGGVKTVTQPMDVDLVQGDNVVLFKCGESGGDDYINLHFEDSDSDIDIVPTEEGDFWIYAGLAVEARDKASTTWGELKAR